MKFLIRIAINRVIKLLFKDSRLSNIKELAEFINSVYCDTVEIEGLTKYYNSLTTKQKEVADKTFRLILAYLLNRAGIKINYDKIK